MISFNKINTFSDRVDVTGADLRLLAGVPQSVVVICRSTYERGGGVIDTCVVLLTERLILAGC